MPSFKLKPEHIKIMTDLNFRISILIDSKDRYRPAIDIKRPFGNSGPTTNVCEIMGWLVMVENLSSRLATEQI